MQKIERKRAVCGHFLSSSLVDVQGASQTEVSVRAGKEYVCLPDGLYAYVPHDRSEWLSAVPIPRTGLSRLSSSRILPLPVQSHSCHHPPYLAGTQGLHGKEPPDARGENRVSHSSYDGRTKLCGCQGTSWLPIFEISWGEVCPNAISPYRKRPKLEENCPPPCENRSSLRLFACKHTENKKKSPDFT